MAKTRIALGFAAVLLVTIGTAAFAEQPKQGERPLLGNLIGTKLFRGLANTATGWVELPKQFSLSLEESGPQGFGPGVYKGFVHALGRTFVGIYEVVTFPVAVPPDYQPILDPEYVLSDRPAHPDDKPSGHPIPRDNFNEPPSVR